MERRVTQREPERWAELLRQDAARERPGFSEALHGRILRQLPAKPDAPVVIRLTEPRPGRVGWSAWRSASLVAAGAVLAVVTLVIVGAGPDPAGGRSQSVAIVAADAAAAGEFGIERVPMYDELEEGVRQGVSLVAVTLLDVPEWRMLADFDAAGFLGSDSAR